MNLIKSLLCCFRKNSKPINRSDSLLTNTFGFNKNKINNKFTDEEIENDGFKDSVQRINYLNSMKSDFLNKKKRSDGFDCSTLCKCDKRTATKSCNTGSL